MFEVDGMTLEQQEKYLKNSILSSNVKEFVSNTTTVQNETINLERELRLIEAKIRDAEFDLNISQRRMDACMISKSTLNLYIDVSNKNGEYRELLLKLRQQRNELIEKI